MSLATWKKEHYPTPADRFHPAKRGPKVTYLSAIRHALRKWLGLTKAALKRHELQKMPSCPFILYDGTKCLVGGAACSLCQWHLNVCAKCILFQLEQRECSFGSAYLTWASTGDARPMIRLLRRAEREEMQRIEKEKP